MPPKVKQPKEWVKIKPLEPKILTVDQLDDYRVSLGAKLRLIRKFKGLSMDKVCEDLKISKSQLSIDEARPLLFDMSASRLIKYCAYYGVELVVFNSNFKLS